MSMTHYLLDNLQGMSPSYSTICFFRSLASTCHRCGSQQLIGIPPLCLTDIPYLPHSILFNNYISCHVLPIGVRLTVTCLSLSTKSFPIWRKFENFSFICHSSLYIYTVNAVGAFWCRRVAVSNHCLVGVWAYQTVDLSYAAKIVLPLSRVTTPDSTLSVNHYVLQ